MKNKSNTNNQAETMPKSELKLSKGDLLDRYHGSKRKHYFYGAVSFAMTAMFYVSFTSPEWMARLSSSNLSDQVTAGVWALLGLVFSIVITVLIMHSHTTDKGTSRLSAYALIIVMGITFNVFTETASTMDRVDERVVAKSESSAVFKALTSKIKHSSGEASTALIKAKNDYADAISTKNARCEQGSNYSATLCRKWTMRADEYKVAMGLHSEGAKSELSQTVNEAKQAGRDSEYAQMVIKLAMEKLGLSFLVATALISLFIIGTFEVLGIMIGGDYRKYRDLLPLHGIDVHKAKEVKYLKQALIMQNKEDEAKNDYEIEKARRDLVSMKRKQTAQNKIFTLQRELRKLSKVTPHHEPVIAEIDTDYSDILEQETDEVEPVYASKIGFIDTDTLQSKKPVKSKLTEHKKTSVIDTEQKVCNIQSKPSVKDTEQTSVYTDQQIGRMISLHKKAKETKNGSFIKCPVCELKYTKTRNAIFCSNRGKGNHADEFHNAVKPERLKALRNIRRKQGRKATA